MGRKLNRRQFVQATTAAAAAAAAVPATLFGQAPAVKTTSVKPVVVSSSNGNTFKNGGSKTCVETAFAMITGGAGGLHELAATQSFHGPSHLIQAFARMLAAMIIRCASDVP